MNGEQISELSLILQAAETIGTIAVLVIFVYLFYEGKIVSAKVHDKIIEVYESAALETTREIAEKLDAISESNNKCFKAVSKSINRMTNTMKSVKKILETNSGGKA